MDFSVIIPVWNLAQRGYERVVHMLESLALQDFPQNLFDVWVVDGSRPSLQIHLQTLLNVNDRLAPLRYHHVELKNVLTFNKPMLVNTGIKCSKGEYLICTDADYLYSPTLLMDIYRKASPDTYLIKKVRMLQRKEKVDYDRIKNWDFPHCPENPYGDLADGGCQVFHRSWFDRCGGYDERMEGWCGMDNDMTNRARRAGLDVKWVEQGHILHQWHAVEKGRSTRERKKMEANWHIRDTDTSIERNR